MSLAMILRVFLKICCFFQAGDSYKNDSYQNNGVKNVPLLENVLSNPFPRQILCLKLQLGEISISSTLPVEIGQGDAKYISLNRPPKPPM